MSFTLPAEHLLSIISAINYASFCNRTDDPIRNFFEMTNDEIFYVLNYSTPLALWGKIQNVYSTFIWNYMDIMVMIVSIGLASKFRQLNDNLLKFKGLVRKCNIRISPFITYLCIYLAYGCSLLV